MREWAVAALDLVFPALCPLCATALGAARRDPLCGACWRSVQRIAPPLCRPIRAASRTKSYRVTDLTALAAGVVRYQVERRPETSPHCSASVVFP